MRSVLLLGLVAGCLLIGGCQSRVDIKQTPEYQRVLNAKTEVEFFTQLRAVERKYDRTWDAFDEAYFATVLVAAAEKDQGKISAAQFEARNREAFAVRVARQRAVAAADYTARAAGRAANRSYSCQTYSNGTTTCY